MKLEDKMKKKSDDQLLDIIILKSFKYDHNTINAAQNELVKRDIPNLEEVKDKIIRDNFKDLDQLRDDELIQYIVKLKLDQKKSLKEIKQILFFGFSRKIATPKPIRLTSRHLPMNGKPLVALKFATWIQNNVVLSIYFNYLAPRQAMYSF